jgi:heme/copper-type cytochrome/quinol oxidase subunit 2
MTAKELEKKIAKWHHRLELVRTVVPLVILTIQLAIAYKMFYAS